MDKWWPLLLLFLPRILSPAPAPSTPAPTPAGTSAADLFLSGDGGSLISEEAISNAIDQLDDEQLDAILDGAGSVVDGILGGIGDSANWLVDLFPGKG